MRSFPHSSIVVVVGVVSVSLFASITARAADDYVPQTPFPTEEEAPLAPLPPSAKPVTTTSAEVEVAQPAAATTRRDSPQALPPNEQPGTGDAPTRGLKPMQIDARGALNADALLAYIGLGASGEIGIAAIGSGTLAVGAGFEYDFCGSACWTFSAATPMTFSQAQLWPQARASYHFTLPRAKNLDLYPFVGLGPVFSKSKIGVDNGAARYVGSDTAAGLNMGFGAQFFPTNGPFFVGGEGHLRYAGGSYDYRLESGDGSRIYDKGAVKEWSLSGIDVLLALGVRIQ